MMNKEEKIYNSIALQKSKIEEIDKVIQQVVLSETKNIRIKIETKHWYGYSEPFLSKDKHKIELTKDTTISILQGIKNRCTERINKLIDMEIESRSKEVSNMRDERN